ADLRRNVLAFLSLERYKQRDRLQADTLGRLQGRAEREVKAALRPYGFYDPVIRTQLAEVGNGRDWRVLIDIDPGQPVVMTDVRVLVTGPGGDDPVFQRVLANIKLRRGDRLNHRSYDETKGNLQRTAATYGYLDARLVESELRVDPPQHTAAARLELVTGVRYRFGPTTIEQAVIGETLVRRYLRYREGGLYDATELLRTQFALDDSQYFSTVEVLPGERDTQTHIVPVHIRGDAARRNRYQFGLGYGTDTRGRGTVAWDDRRINSAGHRSHVELRAASQQATLDARYLIPFGDPALEKLTLELSAERSRETADLTFNQLAFQPSITQVLGRWQRVFFTIFTNTRTDTVAGSSTDTLLIPGVSYSAVPRGFLGEALFSRAFYAELRGSNHVLGSNSDFLQLRLQGERVFELSTDWHLLVRSELGSTAVSNFGALPGSQRFFAGGDRSVRGYGFNDLSPVTEDPTTHLPVKEGGRNLLTGAVEIERDLPRNFGVALFVDAGNAFNTIRNFKYSVGVGLRFRLSVVTVGIDVAQPLVGVDCLNTVAATDPRCRNGVLDRGGPRLHLNFSPKL
ncbi:MAG: BamA/TamA family outer membrane protein, partial [Steroidobacteraceae bacterium]